MKSKLYICSMLQSMLLHAARCLQQNIQKHETMRGILHSLFFKYTTGFQLPPEHLFKCFKEKGLSSSGESFGAQWRPSQVVIGCT